MVKLSGSIPKKVSDGSKDVFVHKNNVVGLGYNEGLDEGEEVEYEVEQTPKGLSAQNVSRA